MKKLLFLSAFLFGVSSSFAITGYAPYKLYVQRDTVTHINLDSNFMRPSNWSIGLADSVDRKFIRFTDFNSHDSTLKYLAVDTIRSGPDIDTIKGDTRFTGSPTVAGSVTATGFTGPLTGNSSGVHTGNVTGNVTGNTSGSSGSCTGNSVTATTATNLSGGTVSGTTGIFSGLVTAPNFGDEIVNFSGTTITGWATTAVKSIKYKKIGKLIHLWFDIDGTSNSNVATITLPSPSPEEGSSTWCMGNDNGTQAASSYSATTAGSLIMNIYKGSGLLWTTTGPKRVLGQVTYIAQ